MGNAEKTRLRTIFVSDVHLGSKGCRADLLLEFLKSVDVDYLFLVGDIVDLWAMRKNFYWPQEHNNVLRIILSKAKKAITTKTCANSVARCSAISRSIANSFTT